MLNKYISVKLGFAIILLVVAILVPLSFSLHQFFIRFYEEQLISSLVTHGKYIEQMIRNKDLADPTIQHAAFNNLMDSELVLIDPQSKVVLNTGVPNLKIGDSLQPQFSSALKQRQIFNGKIGKWIVVGIPAHNTGSMGVLLYAPIQPIRDIINQALQMILLSGLGAILLAIGLTWIVSKRLVKPLLAMKEAAQALSQGNFQVEIPVRGNDEVAQLGYAINLLANELQELQKSRKEFLSNVSHELRTPLSYLKGYSQALDEGMVKTEADQKKTIQVIRHEADRLTRLVEDLFDLTQMDEGRLRLLKNEVDLNQLIRKMIHTLEPIARAKGIQLAYEASTPLPMMEGDEGRLSQVMFNLLDNAIRYTPSEGKINVSAEIQNDFIKIDVSDTGAGISEKEQSRVWERFYRVEKSRARELGGTGLGLAIVKQIVQGHHGQVEIESKEQAGTTITVKIPINSNKGKLRR